MSQGMYSQYAGSVRYEVSQPAVEVQLRRDIISIDTMRALNLKIIPATDEIYSQHMERPASL